MSAGQEVTLRVKRYRPEYAPEPYYEEYQVPVRSDTMVLDALNYVKDELDGSLTFRWSCRMGICGSCAAMVNGVPHLTCSLFVKDLKRRVVRVDPLAHFPVIKDLVVDMGQFVEKLRAVKPWLIRHDRRGLEEQYLQMPWEVEQYRQYSLCINCMICYAACPVYGLDSEFLGPAALALAQRYTLDTRDQGAMERMEAVAGKAGIWDCTFVGECSVVCPKNVDPAIAIQQLKSQGAFQLALPRR